MIVAPRPKTRGFTLIELAVGLCVIALVLGSVLVPLHTQLESRRFEETQRILDQAREALLGFVSANGYFPCPADATSNGQEALGPSGHDSVAGSCTTYHGFLPAAALGFTPIDAQGYAVDAWALNANRIRYAVFSGGALGSALVRSGGMANTGISALGSATMFNLCGSGAGAGASNCGSPLPPGQIVLATNAAVVLWSVGPRAAAASVHELENLDNDAVFVSRVRSSASGAQFDDVVAWIPSTVAIARMIAAGQLP